MEQKTTNTKLKAKANFPTLFHSFILYINLFQIAYTSTAFLDILACMPVCLLHRLKFQLDTFFKKGVRGLVVESVKLLSRRSGSSITSDPRSAAHPAVVCY